MGRQQAADAIVGEKHVKVPQEASLGLIWFVLCPQDLVGDDLPEDKDHDYVHLIHLHVACLTLAVYRTYCCILGRF